MNKKLITAVIVAFIAVKNPAAALAETEIVLNKTETERANAISEANIAENLESIYSKQFMTVDQKAEIQLISYREELEKQRKEKEEQEAIANASKIEKLNKAGLSAKFLHNYLAAENAYHVPWEVIAAVHYVETHQSGDTAVTSYAGAQGPMQFMPSTFRAYAQDGDNNGTTSIGDVDDAIFTGANYLASNGAANGNVTGGLYRYNHDMGYVNHVLSIARSIGFIK
jgi:membrane-bound lytic murein transglycosylase B